MTPETPRNTRIAASLLSLAQHYPTRARTAGEQALWLSDYLTDLASFDEVSIGDAITRWRRTEAKGFPRPGDLVSAAKASSESKGDRAKLLSSPKLGPWRPLEDFEYDELSLPAKIGHRRMMADHVTLQWKHTHDHQVDDEWRRLRAVADGHSDEAKRLKGYLSVKDIVP